LAIPTAFALEGAAAAQDPTFLVNGSFEQASPQFPDTPDGWWPSERSGALTDLAWDDQVSVDGLRSVRIDLQANGSGGWHQNVKGLPPNRNFLFSGWIRTRDVVPFFPVQNAGAYLIDLNGRGTSEVIAGTTQWTWVRLAFNSGPDGTRQLGVRLAADEPFVTGTAWFDDLRLTAIDVDDPHPRWKIPRSFISRRISSHRCFQVGLITSDTSTTVSSSTQRPPSRASSSKIFRP
jgi:hypothetical protein